jgi:anti-anti-sigma factor
MPTQIKQIDDDASDRTILRVSGSLTMADAELIQRLCSDLYSESERHIVIDLAEVDFLDSDSASVLSSLREMYGVELEGVHLLVQNAIDIAERSGES